MFSRIFQQLKIYLSLIKWLREYISHYANVFKFLQIKKTKLLKKIFKINNVKKTYTSRICLNNSISLKIKIFRNFQTLLSISRNDSIRTRLESKRFELSRVFETSFEVSNSTRKNDEIFDLNESNSKTLR